MRYEFRRGSTRMLDDVSGDAAAVVQLRSQVDAASSAAASRSRAQWWITRAAVRGIPPYPVSVSTFTLAAALLRKGGYRSGPAYLSEIKKSHVRKGFRWNDQLQLVHREAIRALERGLGPARRAGPFPLLRLLEPHVRQVLDSARRPHWPAEPVGCIVVSSAWMLREIESSAADRDSVTLHANNSAQGPCGWAEWCLPVSKVDHKALGKVRSLACACPAPGCPVLHMRRVAAASDAARQTADALGKPWPLIVSADGQPLSKDQVVRFYREAVSLAGHSAAEISGHSARVTGAMRMAEAGHPVWVIQVFGRWGSAAVLGYVREAILGTCGGSLAAITEQRRTSLRGLKRRLAGNMRRRNLSSGRKKRTAAVAAATEDFVGTPLGASAGQPSVVTSDAIDILAQKVSRIEGGLRILSGEACPEYVKCKERLKHRVATSTRTGCGWAWRRRGGQVVLSGPGMAGLDDSNEWCKRCLT